MITCTECGHENEVQRVYCHSCGARLDRSSLVDEAQKPQKVVKPTRKPVGDGSGKLIGNLVKTIIFAGLAACIIEACRPPVDAPSDQRELGADIIDAPSISMDLETAESAPSRLRYSAAQLNAFLKNRVKPPKNPTIPVWAIAFDSSYVILQKDRIQLTKKWLFFSLPAYTGGTYVPLLTTNSLTMKPVSGNIGRLPLPGVLFDLVDDYLFADVAKSLHEEAKGAAKMQSIQVSPQAVLITSGAPKK